jgi:hypothetical protein
MTKTQSGVVLIAGPVVAFIGGSISGSANNATSTPDTDWFYSLINGGGIVLILIGLAMFFAGAMFFARK